MNNQIDTWARGRFIDKPQYDRLGEEFKVAARELESYLVRPAPTENSICKAIDPDAAEWIADRLNAAARLQNMVVSACFMDEIPTFQAGEPHHEVQDVVDVAMCEGFVNTIEEQKATISQLQGIIAGLREELRENRTINVYRLGQGRREGSIQNRPPTFSFNDKTFLAACKFVLDELRKANPSHCYTRTYMISKTSRVFLVLTYSHDILVDGAVVEREKV